MATDPAGSPRISPRLDEDLDEASRELLAMGLQPGAPQATNLMRTLVWYPGLLRRWLPYGAKLLAGGKLPVRLREICILRVGVRLGCDYEWSQHFPMGLEAGLSAAEIRALAGDGEVDWGPLEAAVIGAVDELHDGGRIGDTTWSVLRGAFDEPQLVELPLLVGAYTGLAYFLNSFGVQVELGLTGLTDSDPERSAP